MNRFFALVKVWSEGLRSKNRLNTPPSLAEFRIKSHQHNVDTLLVGFFNAFSEERPEGYDEAPFSPEAQHLLR